MHAIDSKPAANARKEVIAASNAVYAPGSGRVGWLLFARDSTLMGQPFNTANARIMGEATPIAEKVDYLGGVARGPILSIG